MQPCTEAVDRVSPDTLVSIVTPAYTAGRFIAETIHSVLAQTHNNWELIIVDDGSPDDTCSIVEQISREDCRIRLIRQRRNLGPSVARNRGLEAASGRYIAFLDADDLWLPQKLERQIQFMGDVNAAISFTAFRRISETGDRCGRLIRIPERLTYGQLLRNTAIAASAVLIDRGLTGAFQMSMAPCDDYFLWLEFLRRGFVAHGLQEDLMRYRVVEASCTRNKRKNALNVWRTYREIGLSKTYAAWCFTNYAIRAWLKYSRF